MDRVGGTGRGHCKHLVLGQWGGGGVVGGDEGSGSPHTLLSDLSENLEDAAQRPHASENPVGGRRSQPMPVCLPPGGVSGEGEKNSK